MFRLASSALLLAALIAPATLGQTTFAKPGAFSSAVFGPVDGRSIYGKGIFPEPLLAPEMDVERELRLDWLHQEKRGFVGDEAKAEVEWNFGYLTVEVELPYVHETEVTLDDTTGFRNRERSEGLGSVELSARYPLVNFVSADGKFDYTLVGAFELALPTRTDVSKDTEVVPQLYQLMAFGRRLTLQTSVGYSTLIGNEEGGTATLEYSAVLGYMFDHRDLPIPGVRRIIPLAEIVGEHPFNGDGAGRDILTGTLGARILFNAIGPVQPRLGIGYVYPINDAAREEFRWGIITSLAFEF